ncbi:hypothetical protein [Helicobacter anatolicus]|uniref:hypothetical protein n=1 Tax=Helicobacter anatolicus TaxID=2905874 RepID=UPI001E36AFA0|nr:hypothetical protein [Helicobacter anatolicus]MCE3038809.1 hypothetical protein [Helicobacter anatolicus]MCE3039694.1 hypothetical protein [Helicobacter anatolicus]
MLNRAFITLEVLIALMLTFFVLQIFFDFRKHYQEIIESIKILRLQGVLQKELILGENLFKTDGTITTQNNLVCQVRILHNKGNIFYRYFEVKQCE